jgi:transcriptional regulator with XRE-family HTH domain
MGRPIVVRSELCSPWLRTRSTFGKHVRELRLKCKLSQEKLAELADLHRNYLGVLERGRQNPSLLIILKLARALDVKPAKLIDRIP